MYTHTRTHMHTRTHTYTHTHTPMYTHTHTHTHTHTQASLVAQRAQNVPAMQETQETWVQPLGWKDSLEEEMATPSSIIAWGIQWTKEPLS